MQFLLTFNIPKFIINSALSYAYYETCTESNFGELGEVIGSGVITNTSEEKKYQLVVNEELQATSSGATVYYYVVLEYPNYEESQNIDIGGSFDGEVSIEIINEKQTTKEVDTVLGTLTVNLEKPDFSKTAKASCSDTSVCEATVGLYEETTSKGTTYYYRGDVENNYLEFADKYWRIIRINEDGSVRVIYSGDKATVDAAGKETVLANGYNDRNTQYTIIQESVYNRLYDQSEYVGFKYTLNEQHGQNTDSSILNTLQSWYTSSGLSEYSKYISKSAGFCNDRNTASYDSWVSTGTRFDYAAYERLETNKNPSFSCTSTDIIVEPVGLITADEHAYI